MFLYMSSMIYLFVCQCIHYSIHILICLPIFMYLCICRPTKLPASLTVCLFIYLSIYYLSIYPSIRQFIIPSINLFTSTKAFFLLCKIINLIMTGSFSTTFRFLGIDTAVKVSVTLLWKHEKTFYTFSRVVWHCQYRFPGNRIFFDRNYDLIMSCFKGWKNKLILCDPFMYNST